MRFITLLLLIFPIFILVEDNVFSQEKMSINKVVIDAGHGGKDPGTIGKKSQEKNITLEIALKLADDIRSQCKGVTVICTRTTDEFIELHERAEIANRSKADMFISIHCNANPKHTFQGAETYVMGLHRTEANLEIAKKENAAILMEPDYSVNYNGFDPNSDESYITFTLFQNAFLEQSTWFASLVQDEMKDRVGMYDRGVRQAGFLVLYKTTMPSVLVETGFLSNPEEEKFLISQKGQQYIASAICRAFIKFKSKMEGNGKEIASLNSKTSPPKNNDVGTPADKKVTNPPEGKTKQIIPVKDSTKAGGKSMGEPVLKVTDKPKNSSTGNAAPKVTGKPQDSSTGNPPSKVTEKPKEKPREDAQLKSVENVKEKPEGSPKTNSGVKPDSQAKKNTGKVLTSKDTLKTKPREKAGQVKKDSGHPEGTLAANTGNPNAVKSKPVTKTSTKTEEVSSNISKPSEEVVFRIQIATSQKEISIHSKKFAGLPDIWKYQHQGLFKLTAGKGSNPEELADLVKKVKKMGFTDAFIVAFHGKERITVAEAKLMIQEKK